MRLRKTRPESVDINLTPLIDVVFLLLIFFLSCKGVANVLIAQLINISENTISDWRQIVYANVARYFLSNPVPLGG